MNWFHGSIQDAVATSKKSKSYFVVYIEGTDEQSITMTEVLDSERISRKFDSNNFVAIKLAKGSEGHKQFEDIYKLVPVPSVFFINQNGVPVEIVVSGTSKDTVLNKVIKAIDTCVPASSSPLPDSQPSTSAASCNVNPPSCPSTSGVENLPSSSVVVTKEDKPSTSSSQDKEALEESSQELTKASAPDIKQNENDNNVPLDERIEKAKIYLENKKVQEEAENKEKEIAAERERRKAGQQLQLAKRQQEDKELRQMREEREREKREEYLARQRVLQQIERDRADRQQRLAKLDNNKQEEGGNQSQRPGASNPVITVTAASSNAAMNVNIGRLQFKLPNGETKSHTFPAETTLNQVREFIDNNIVLPFSEYQMATTFPRREFTARDNNRDLRSLQLVPSAVILILPLSGNVSMRARFAWTQVLINMMWDLVQPVFTFSRYISSFIFRRRDDRPGGPGSSNFAVSEGAQPSATTQRQGGRGSNIKKRGNIYSLRDKNDDDDDNNTWNGNSTQQM